MQRTEADSYRGLSGRLERLAYRRLSLAVALAETERDYARHERLWAWKVIGDVARILKRGESGCREEALRVIGAYGWDVYVGDSQREFETVARERYRTTPDEHGGRDDVFGDRVCADNDHNPAAWGDPSVKRRRAKAAEEAGR